MSRLPHFSTKIVAALFCLVCVLQAEKEKALQVCDKINTKRTSQNLESEIKQIQKQIAAEEKV